MYKFILVSYNNKLTALIETHLCLEFKTVNCCHAFKKNKMNNANSSNFNSPDILAFTSLSVHLFLHLNIKGYSVKAGQHLTGKSWIRESVSSILRSIHSFWHTAKEKHKSSLKEALNSTAEWLWKWPPLYLSTMYVLTLAAPAIWLQSKKSKAQEHVPSHSLHFANKLKT